MKIESIQRSSIYQCWKGIHIQARYWYGLSDPEHTTSIKTNIASMFPPHDVPFTCILKRWDTMTLKWKPSLTWCLIILNHICTQVLQDLSINNNNDNNNNPWAASYACPVRAHHRLYQINSQQPRCEFKLSDRVRRRVLVLCIAIDILYYNLGLGQHEESKHDFNKIEKITQCPWSL